MSTLRARSSFTTELLKATSSAIKAMSANLASYVQKVVSQKYFQPKSWKDNPLKLSLRDYEPSLNIQPESCICRSYRNESTKVHMQRFAWSLVQLQAHINDSKHKYVTNGLLKLYILYYGCTELQGLFKVHL